MNVGWETRILRDCTVKIGSGATPKGGKESYLDKGISLIRSQNVHDFRFSVDGLAFINEEQAYNLKNVIVEENDVLVNITGDSVARVCSAPKEHIPARVNQHVAIIRPKSDKLNWKFLKYFLLSPNEKANLLMLSSSGATRNALTKGMLENLKINLPPLPEQKAIAHILGTLDDKIELNRQMNQTLEAMAQALFKSWFVDFDPVMDNALTAGAEIPDELQAMAEKRSLVPASKKLISTNAELAAKFPSSFVFNETLGRWIPEGWEVVKLKSIGISIRENRSPEEISNTDIYVGLEHIGRKQIFLSQNGFGDEISSNKSSFKKGDVLFGKLRPYFHKVCIAPTKGVCSTDILVFRAKKEEFKSFLTMILFQEELVEYANMRSTGTRMPRASQKDIQDFDIALPPFEVLKKYDCQANFLFSKGLQSVKETGILTEIRDRLLPELISGRMRVKEFKGKFSQELELVAENTEDYKLKY